MELPSYLHCQQTYGRKKLRLDNIQLQCHLVFSPFPLPFLCFKTFQLFSKPWTSFQQRHPSFYSCRFPFLLSQCSGTKRIALVYIWSLTWGYIQPHSVTGNCQKTFCTAISFFSNSFSGFYGKRKILSILLRRLNLLKGDKRSFFTSRIIFTKVVFRLLFCGRPILEALHVSFQPLFFSTDLFRPKANLETQSVETRLRKFN